jgi:phosphohistidine phosphatase
MTSKRSAGNMAIYLVQHGKSMPKDIDPEQGLSEQGIAEVKRIAEVARGYHIPVKSIVCSMKKRARQTAEIFASILGIGTEVLEIEGIKPLDDVAEFAKTLKNEDNRMVVGHQPFMQRLISFLILDSTEPAVFKVQNGGIFCLDKDPDTDRWIIRWAIMPDIR